MIGEEEDSGRFGHSSVRLSFSVFLSVYLGTMALGFAVGIMLERVWGVDLTRSLFAYMTVLFSLGALRRPELLFQVLRSTG